MKSKLSASALILALALVSPAAHAVPIDYIFTGTGEGTLNGMSFDGAFNFTVIGDTANVSGGGTNFVSNTGTGSFSSGALSTTLSNAETVINSSTSFVTLQFVQVQTVPSFNVVSEAIVDSGIAGYNLDTPYALIGPFTGGGINVADQTYQTAAGDLDFTGISSLSFEAVEPSAVPLPASLPMMFTALAALGAFAFARRKAI